MYTYCNCNNNVNVIGPMTVLFLTTMERKKQANKCDIHWGTNEDAHRKENCQHKCKSLKILSPSVTHDSMIRLQMGPSGIDKPLVITQ